MTDFSNIIIRLIAAKYVIREITSTALYAQREFSNGTTLEACVWKFDDTFFAGIRVPDEAIHDCGFYQLGGLDVSYPTADESFENMLSTPYGAVTIGAFAGIQ